MAKQPKPKPVNAKGRNDQRRNGKANKKNPRTNPIATNSAERFGYTLDTLMRRAAKRNQTLDEHLAYLEDHRNTRSIRRRNARLEMRNK